MEYTVHLKKQGDGFTFKVRLQKSILISVLCKLNIKMPIEKYQRVMPLIVNRSDLWTRLVMLDLYFWHISIMFEFCVTRFTFIIRQQTL